MKTILIDPFTRTITETEYNGELSGTYALLQVDIVEAVRLRMDGENLWPNGDSLFIHEEGMLGDLTAQAFFVMDGNFPLAGRAMTVGCDYDTGETIEATVTLADLQARVSWIEFPALVRRFG